MNKASYEYALTIKLPPPKTTNQLGGKPADKYTAPIEGNLIRATSKWWGKRNTEAFGIFCSATLVQQRRKRGYSEEAACLAKPSETEKQYYQRIGKTPSPKSAPTNIVDKYLASKWVHAL